MYAIWTLQNLAPETIQAIRYDASIGMVDLFLRSAEQAAIQTIMEGEKPVQLLNKTAQTFGWSPFSLEYASWGGRGGRHWEAMIEAMQPWMPDKDVLGVLRRSLGINADPEDMKDLDPAMVSCYNETSYAKVREWRGHFVKGLWQS